MPAVLLAIWQLVTATGLFSASQLPPPADVVTALGGLVRHGELWTHLRASVSRVLLGYLPAQVLRSRWVRWSGYR